MMWFRLGILLNVVLQVLDGLSTFYAIRCCGAIEVNPLSVYFMEKFGLEVGLIIPKVAVVAILIYLLKFNKNQSMSLSYTFYFLNIFYAFVIGSNFALINFSKLSG